jgi:hypothetical protein
MVHYHDFVQGSDEWHEFRKDKLTGSNATAIGALGYGLRTYCMRKAAELIGIKKENYTNSDMERGNELEPIAIKAYEFKFNLKVESIGCITNDKYSNVCVSPDGLINLDGGLEIKARNESKHFALIQGIETDIPKNQIQMCLLISERKYWDSVSFNPNFSKPLFVKRIYPDYEYFNKLEAGFIEGRKLIAQYLKNYNEYK